MYGRSTAAPNFPGPKAFAIARTGSNVRTGLEIRSSFWSWQAVRFLLQYLL